MKTYETQNISMGSVESGGTYDLLLFNNATKQGYVYRSLYDSGEATYYQFNGFEMGDDMPFGEYSYALIPSTGYAEYDFKDNLLDTLVGGGNLKLRDLQPVVGLLKYVDDEWEAKQNEPTYRDTDTEYFYRRKNS